MTGDTTNGHGGHDPYAPLAIATARRAAEKLRREAVYLAVEYQKVAELHHLDSEIIALDAHAVVMAWESLS